MNRELSFESVIARAKEAFGVKTDKGLADAIAITPQVLGNRKKTESIPFAEIVAAAMQTGADVQYILTGVRSASAPSLSPREAALLDNYRHIDDEGDKRLVERTAQMAVRADKDETQSGKKKAG